MIRGAILAVLAVAVALPAHAQFYPGGPLYPGDYSFAPAGAPPSNEASVGYGSRNMSSESLRMDRGLPGIPGARAFIALGNASGPDLKGIVPGARGGVVSHGAAIGVEKSFLDGTTISLQGAWEQDRLHLLQH